MQYFTHVLFCAGLTLGLIQSARAHDHPDLVSARITTPQAEVAGTLMLPHLDRDERAPCVMLVGGAASNLRDGGTNRPGLPPRTTLKRLAEELVVGGYASLRYDQVGHGGSRPRAGWINSYQQQAEIVNALLTWLRRRPEIGRVVIAGEGRGAHVACLAAAQGAKADAWLFFGPVCGAPEELFAYGPGRLAAYVDSHPDHLAWSRRHDLRLTVALGRHYPAMLAAAREGKPTFDLADGDFRQTLPLAHLQEELARPSDSLFRHIQAPALVLAGEFDLHVPPEHADRAVAAIRAAGNRQAMHLLISGADHHFQQAASDEATRLRERYSGQGIQRPYIPDFYREVLAWLHVEVPTPAEGRTHVAGRIRD